MDDEPQILEALALTLGRTSEVEMAPSGGVGLEVLRAMPDTTIIISDMRMPSMNRGKFLAASRKIAPNARQILLTGNADIASAILAANEGGILRLLTKPYSFAQIVEAVEASIADYDDDMRERSAIRRSVTQEILSHDLLTGLASPAALLERLDLYHGAAEAGEWRTEVVLVIEIADLEELSDDQESKTTDQIIRFLSMKLGAHLSVATLVALIVPINRADAELEFLALSVIAALEGPIGLSGIAIQSRVTVSIARIPFGPNGYPRGALRYSELAAREAKRQGNNPARLFSRASIVKNQRRRETIQALRLALAQQQLSLYYQPIIDIARNRVYFIEALVRWNHAQLGFVSPTIFIPLAEETGLMIPPGECVMNHARTDGQKLLGSLFNRISVNVSVAQILDSRFMYILYQAIEKSGLEPSALELKLTETVFAEHLERVCKLLSEVRLLGISVAIDDFVAGYSSLAYLNRLPIDVLKNDPIFGQDFDRRGEAIIAAALAVAHNLRIEVIVEGIETEPSLQRVCALSATKIQGYFFAHPMPATGLLSWHAEFANRPWAA